MPDLNHLLPHLSNEQWIGVLGYSLAIVGFMFRADLMVKGAITLACLVNGFYFFAVEMFITAAINGLTALRVGLSMFWRPAWLGVAFILLSISMPWWIDSADWLAVTASVSGTIAVFWLSGLAFRWMMLVTTALLMANAWQGEAWAGVLGEGIILVISAIRIYTWNPKLPVDLQD